MGYITHIIYRSMDKPNNMFFFHLKKYHTASVKKPAQHVALRTSINIKYYRLIFDIFIANTRRTKINET